ncbi:MAG: D-alanyl-D-alanine carboxypeptidase, partial [Lachnospiraceae bacterium]|nr:D-alanyl-D-alanine carboxypeptidase [Lachnospiraceae bacterium]
MLKKIIFILFSLIFFSLNPLNLLAEENQPQIELYAEAAVLMDASSGRVLYGKNPSEVLAMASTTKILTCILALENGNLSDYAEVSAYAARMPQVKLNMREGEFYRLEDLLYSLMLESHNDTAVAVAEHIGGSVENFAKMMNDKAKEIGCLDSYFITPSGLDAESEDKSRFHSTTARELALIMSYCILESPQKEAFLKITGTQNYQFGNYKITDVMEYETGGRNFSLTNRNAFLSMMEGAMSGKTGFTGRA